MPKISEDIIRAVTDAARIEDVVGDFVQLRKAGVNLTGRCPFHDDQHDGNFIVRPSTISEQNYGNTYHCFVCDKGGGAVKFLMEAEGMTFPDAIRWLGKKYSIDVDNVPLNWTPPPPRPLPPPLPVLTLPREWVTMTMRMATRSALVRWLYSLPWSEQQRTRLPNTLWQYCVGDYPQKLRDDSVREWTCFWQIDEQGVPRAAKLMYYHDNGKRGREKRDTSYLYALPEFERLTDYQHHQVMHPLFGAHLLKRHPQAVVNLVESEKTAIIMANYYGDPDGQLWLAAGGLKWLKLEAMQPLVDQGRTIWLWPDKDGREAWQTVADKLGYDRCRVYTHFFDTCWREEDGDKADVADIAIRMMTTGEGPRKDTGNGQGATDSKSTEAYHSGANPAPTPDTLTAVKEWKLAHPDDEPFLDRDEMLDPRIREWREIIRQRYNYKNKKRDERREKTL